MTELDKLVDRLVAHQPVDYTDVCVGRDGLRFTDVKIALEGPLTLLVIRLTSIAGISRGLRVAALCDRSYDTETWWLSRGGLLAAAVGRRLQARSLRIHGIDDAGLAALLRGGYPELVRRRLIDGN